MAEWRDQAPTPPKSYLAGIMATGLAAAIGAVLTSFAGLEGTVLGAVVAAMVISVSTQVAQVPFHVAERRLIEAGFSAWRLRQLGLLRGAVSTPGVLAKLLRVYVPQRAVVSIVLISSTGFLLGMAGLSVVELARGRPVSATSANEVRSATTVGNIVQPLVQSTPGATATLGEGQAAVAKAGSPTPGAIQATATATTAAAATATATMAAAVKAAPTATSTATRTPMSTPTNAPARVGTAAPTQTVTATPTAGRRQ